MRIHYLHFVAVNPEEYFIFIWVNVYKNAILIITCFESNNVKLFSEFFFDFDLYLTFTFT